MPTSAHLYLQDGSIYSGCHFGADVDVDGEIGNKFFA